MSARCDVASSTIVIQWRGSTICRSTYSTAVPFCTVSFASSQHVTHSPVLFFYFELKCLGLPESGPEAACALFTSVGGGLYIYILYMLQTVTAAVLEMILGIMACAAMPSHHFDRFLSWRAR